MTDSNADSNADSNLDQDFDITGLKPHEKIFVASVLGSFFGALAAVILAYIFFG